jgi:hypothetical protein
MSRHATSVDDVISSACRLVAERASIGTITILLGRRPTYRELERWRAFALSCDVRLAVDGFGVVTVRAIHGEPQQQTTTAEGWRCAALPSWIARHVRHWCARWAEAR